MTYRFIDEHRDQWPVRLLCETLEVSPAGYYAWRQRPRQRAAATARRPPRGDPGHPRRGQGPLRQPTHPRRTGGPRPGLLRQHRRQADAGQRHCRPKRRGSSAVRTTDSNHDLPVAENLLDRQFDPAAANEAWVADITYIPTREGWLYLAAVEDLYSRRVVGWSMADHMESRLVVDALEMAVQRRLPGRRAAGALRSRQPVRQRTLPTPPGQARHHVQHEPPGGLLGQRPDGELFRLPEEGIGPRRRLRHAGGGASGDRRVHRGLLQQPTPSLLAGVRLPGGVRTDRNNP